MRLTFDLRLDGAGGLDSDTDVRRDANETAGLVRRPSQMRRLLRGRGWDEVVVLLDEMPPSVYQAVGALVAGFTRGVSQVEVRRGERSVVVPRGRYLACAASVAVLSAPRELLAIALLSRYARREAKRRRTLARSVTEPESVLYIRPEPTLRWRGAFVGGAATHTSGVINGFVSNNLRVDVGAPEQPLGTSGIRFTKVAPRRMLHLVDWLATTEYGREVARRLSGVRADFVYQRYALGTDAGLELADRLKVPLVLEFNGSEVWVHQHWRGGALRMARTAQAIEDRNLDDASLIVVVSEALADQLLEKGVSADRLLVNPNGVDIAGLAPFRGGDVEARRRELGLDSAPTVGFVGTFSEWHGVLMLPDLIDALAELQPTVRWVLIGDGPLHGEVAASIAASDHAERVLMTGLVGRDKALGLLAACDVCVSPHVPNPDGTPFFGSPTKLFEYMGLAKPIVASDLDQIGEVIEDERTGLLVPPGDAAAAAAALDRLLGDSDLRERLGRAALDEATERYSWTAHTRRILDALEAQRA